MTTERWPNVRRYVVTLTDDLRYDREVLRLTVDALNMDEATSFAERVAQDEGHSLELMTGTIADGGAILDVPSLFLPVLERVAEAMREHWHWEAAPVDPRPVWASAIALRELAFAISDGLVPEVTFDGSRYESPVLVAMEWLSDTP